MDTIQLIDEELRKLAALKDDLIRKVGELQHESYELKDSTFSVSNRVKDIFAAAMMHSPGLQKAFGEALHHSLSKKFDNAQDYIDFIAQSVARIKEHVSKIDQVMANLVKCKNDLHYKVDEATTWLRQSHDIQG